MPATVARPPCACPFAPAAPGSAYRPWNAPMTSFSPCGVELKVVW